MPQYSPRFVAATMLVAAVLLFAMTAPAFGQTIVTVGPGGTYSEPGAAFTALEGSGVTEATVIEIEGGTYTTTTEFQIDPISGTSAVNTVTIRPQAGASVTFRGTFASAVSGNATLGIRGASFVIVEDITFDGLGTTNYGLELAGTTGLVSDNLVIRRCRIHNYISCAITALSFPAADGLTNLRLENNMMWACNGANPGWGLGTIFMYRTLGAVVVHNTFVKTSTDNSAVIENWEVTVGQKIAELSSNIIYVSGGGQGYSDNGLGRHPTAADNNVWHIGAGASFSDVAAFPNFAAWQTTGSFDANGLAADSQLEDAPGGDYRLRSNSPAIGLAGAHGVTADIDGNARPQGAAPDTGCHEFSTASLGSTPDIRIEYYPGSFSPDIITSGESLDFGNLGDNVAKAVGFRVTNAGSGDLSVSGVAVTDARSVSVQVVSSPAGATLQGGESRSYTLQVTGVGVTSGTATGASVTATDTIQSTTSGDFSGFSVGDWVRFAGFATGANNTDMQITAINDLNLGGGETQNQLVISGATLVVEAATNPTYATTPPSFTLTTTSNDPDSFESPHVVSVTGTYIQSGAVASDLDLVQLPSETVIASAGTHALGNRPLNVSMVFSYAIVNRGSALLNLTGAPVVNNTASVAGVTMTVSQPSQTALLPGQTTTFTITVNATAATTGTATFEIVNDSAVTPYTFGVSITSGSTSLVDVPDEVVFDTIGFWLSSTTSAASSNDELRSPNPKAGATTVSTKQITISNLGDTAMSYQLTSFDGAGYFSFVSSSLGATVGGGAISIPAASQDIVTIQYQPTSPQGAPYTGTLTITTDTGGAAGTVSIITLTGNVLVQVTGGGGCVIATSPEAIRGGSVTLLAMAALLVALAAIRRRRPEATTRRTVPVRVNRVRATAVAGSSRWLPLLVIAAMLGFSPTTASAQSQWETEEEKPDKPTDTPEPGRDDTVKEDDDGPAPWEGPSGTGSGDSGVDPWDRVEPDETEPDESVPPVDPPADPPAELDPERWNDSFQHGTVFEIGSRFGSGSADDTGANGIDRHWLVIGSRIPLADFGGGHQLGVGAFLEFALDGPVNSTLLRPIEVSADYEYFLDLGDGNSFNLALFAGAGFGLQTLETSVALTKNGSWINLMLDLGIHGYVDPGFAFTVGFGLQRAFSMSDAHTDFTYFNLLVTVGWSF